MPREQTLDRLELILALALHLVPGASGTPALDLLQADHVGVGQGADGPGDTSEIDAPVDAETGWMFQLRIVVT